LGKVLVEFMGLELYGDPRWQKQYDRIQRVLAANNLAFHSEGRIIPKEAERRFRVALSFPGERRPFIADIAADLAQHLGQERVLYDKFYEAEFARPDLDTYLPNLYRAQSELIAIFLCADYAKKRWCKLEWRFVRQLICTSEDSRIMFLSFDDIGPIPEIGILSGDGYVSIGTRPPQKIAKLILQRLQISNRETSLSQPQETPPDTSATKRAVPSSDALVMWQKKLVFLQTEEAKAVDAEQKFAIQQRIEEAKQKIRELGG
ncbi:MAG: TIR domain-containing protein, partial [Planctomycetota bacterium]